MGPSDFRYRPLAPGVLQLTGPLDCRATLVLGARGALLFDVMSGIGDLKGYVATLTELPLTVVCSHSHFDHAGGCYQFDEVWLSPQEYPLTRALREPGERRVLLEKIAENKSITLSPEARERLMAGTFDRYLPLAEGQRFDLGGMTAEAVALPGHTPGSMGLLVPEAGILLSGDAMTPIMCLFFPESLPLEVYRQTLCKAATLPFDRFVTGHMDRTLPKSVLGDFLAAADGVANLRGMAFQYDILPEFGGWMYLYRDGGVCEEDFIAVILRERRPGDQRPRQKGGRK